MGLGLEWYLAWVHTSLSPPNSLVGKEGEETCLCYALWHYKTLNITCFFKKQVKAHTAHIYFRNKYMWDDNVVHQGL